MEKREFNSKNIKELANAFGLKVDNVPTIEILNKIKKVVLLEERLDNTIVLTYEEEPVKRLCSVLQSVGIDNGSYTKLYKNYSEQIANKKQEFKKVLKEYVKQQ
jgi:hypothetical protein